MPREPVWWYAPTGLAALALAPVATVYGAIAGRRLAAAPRHRASIPVICVGNLTAGGSGKTPVAILLAQRLIARGQRPVFLTRGYGGRVTGPHWVAPHTDDSGRVGDEPLLLATVAPVMVARDRAAGARAIEAAGTATVIVMDDGLQNSALAKDLTIAVVDGARGLGNGCVIPSGPMRAPLASQIAHAGMIIFNGAPRSGLREQLGAACGVPMVEGRLTPAGDTAWLSGTRVVAYAGIGNPARFFSTLTAHGAIIAEAIHYRDHARFGDADAERLLGAADRHGARLVTTQKDHVRLAGSAKLAGLAAASTVLPVRMEFDAAAEQVLDARLTSVLGRV